MKNAFTYELEAFSLRVPQSWTRIGTSDWRIYQLQCELVCLQNTSPSRAPTENTRRWSFYVLLIWSAVQWTLLYFLVPETYHPVLLRNEARRLRKETGDNRWHAPIENMDRTIPQVKSTRQNRPQIIDNSPR